MNKKECCNVVNKSHSERYQGPEWPLSLNCPDEPYLGAHPLPRGPEVPFLLSPAWPMLWVILCPALSLADSLIGFPGLSWTWPIAWCSSDCQWAVTSPCSCELSPSNLAPGWWKGSFLMCGHSQLLAWLALWSNHTLAAPWEWDWKVICTKTILICPILCHTSTDKYQDMYTQVVCAACRHQNAWIQVFCPWVLFEGQGHWLLRPHLVSWSLLRLGVMCWFLHVPFFPL